jgi:hypothetical protein
MGAVLSAVSHVVKKKVSGESSSPLSADGHKEVKLAQIELEKERIRATSAVMTASNEVIGRLRSLQRIMIVVVLTALFTYGAVVQLKQPTHLPELWSVTIPSLFSLVVGYLFTDRTLTK